MTSMSGNQRTSFRCLLLVLSAVRIAQSKEGKNMAEKECRLMPLPRSLPGRRLSRLGAGLLFGQYAQGNLENEVLREFRQLFSDGLRYLIETGRRQDLTSMAAPADDMPDTVGNSQHVGRSYRPSELSK